MRIAILRIGPVDKGVVEDIQRSLSDAFLGASCEILEPTMPTFQDNYNVSRHQYNSSNILAKIQGYVEKSQADRVLGITEVDLYVPRLNFVFGEAECPGRTAIISLYRLKPDFYGHSPNRSLFLARSVKEAIHEIGHTLGLGHCSDSTCVMFFSNNVTMTDTKKSRFCDKCWPKIFRSIKRIRA